MNARTHDSCLLSFMYLNIPQKTETANLTNHNSNYYSTFSYTMQALNRCLYRGRLISFPSISLYCKLVPASNPEC